MTATTIAVQEVQSLCRRRVFAAFVGMLVAVTVLAGIIGWSSHNTIVRVYDEAVGLLATEGRAAPPNPFLQVPPLALLSNLAIYLPLIGALMAIIVGHLALADDQSTGIGRLLFSRPMTRFGYLAGKLAGTATVVVAALGASFAVGIAALRIANGYFPTADQVGRLAGFYLLSWLYLMTFVLIGIVAVLLTRRRSLALLGSLGVWLIVTFAMPQFTSGLRPTSSLNPISDPVSTSQRFFQITAQARPLSVSEQYKTASAQILETTSSSLGTGPVLRIVPLLALLGALVVLAGVLINRHDYAEASSDD